MEPLSATGGRVVPKLHLLSADTGYSNNAAISGSVSERLPSRPSQRVAEPPATTRINKVMPSRVSGASVEFLDTTVLQPMQLRPAATPTPTPEFNSTENSTNNRGDAAEFQVLHPAIDELADERGEDLAQLLLSRWSIHSGEEQFASISLFCEMKLNEAKRMASWAEAPNRFYTVVCCQLLEKYISRLATSKTSHNNAGPVVATSGQSIAFLRRIHAELIASIFLPPTQAQVQDHATSGGGVNYEHRIPYFSEFKRLRRNTQALVTTVRERESTRATRQQLPTKVSKLVRHLARRRDRQTLALTFRGWAGAMAAQRQVRALKIQAFQCMRKTNLMAWFRVWHIEALRRAYHRESADYQSMLSVTAASLSRKDIAIAEAEAKVTSMARIIDSLTESNKQLSYRVDQLENLSAAAAFAGGGDGGLENHDSDMDRRQDSAERNSSLGRRRETNYERIDTLLTQDDERMDRTNRMLLETMFGMARMVETCAIQMSKDTMDSLEYQMDGSVLQHLTEMIQTENEIKAKADAAEGSLTALHFGKSAGGRTSTLAAASSSLVTAARPARPRAVTIRDLAQMPIDTLLLYWFRMHLSLSSSVEKPGDRTIKNFTSDLADGRRFSFLLHRLFPSWFDSSMVHELDVDQRLQNIATFHERVQPPLPQVVTSDSIHAASGAENIAFVAMLFGTAVGTVRKLNMEKQRGDFLNIITTWRRVRGLLLEVKRMNDNYDAGMVAHLLKEMRTCETLFKQLHSELDHITVTTNETSSALSQIAYKALSITWSCIRARDIHPHAPLGLVDERTHERVLEFSKIDACCIRDLLVHDTEGVFNQLHQSVGATLMRRKSSATTPVVVTGSAMPPVVPERDVDIATAAVRRALSAYSKDLNDIFKHYSASGGAGSLAAMSLTEFTKFIRDCFTGDKHITPEVAEAIYRAALQLEPPIANEIPIPASTTASAADPGDSEATDEGPELSGRQFSDALVRLAAIKYAPMPAPRATGRGHARAAPTPPLPLDERFRLLMEQDILPHALRSQRELFRAEVAEPKVREVFQRHKPALQRIFRYYASMHALREQNSTLSLSAFIIMARDCKLVGSFVTEHTLKQVLANLQRDEGNSSAPGAVNTEAELEMMRADFSDFQEALAALTEYVVCNPYVPFHKRVDQFIQEMILPRARQKKKPGE